MKKYIHIAVLSFAMLVQLINAQTAENLSVHILGTTNVNGETDPIAPLSQIKIISFKEKDEWLLETKYNIGKNLGSKNNGRACCSM